MHLHRQLTLKEHICKCSRNKRKHLGLNLDKIYWLLDRNSQVTLENKVLFYKTILKLIWKHGIQFWGTAPTLKYYKGTNQRSLG